MVFDAFQQCGTWGYHFFLLLVFSWFAIRVVKARQGKWRTQTLAWNDKTVFISLLAVNVAMGFESWGWKEGIIGLLAFCLFVIHVFDTFQARITTLEEEKKKLDDARHDIEKGHEIADAAFKSVKASHAAERASLGEIITIKEGTIQLLSKQNLTLERMLKEARRPQPEDWN